LFETVIEKSYGYKRAKGGQWG